MSVTREKPLCMILAGGGGTRLGVLVSDRSKPAVPFGGRYRIIDFTLSNVMHAGLDTVGVLTQYQPLSLMGHLGNGEAWNLAGRQRGLWVLPPRQGLKASDWYRGTADAIWQSMDFMLPLRPSRVLILSGDHIYRMDYRRMYEYHLEKKADVTLAVMEVAPQDVSRFGMVWTDGEGIIRRFEEKPRQADTRLASMGIYLFEWTCLYRALARIVGGGLGTDFGQHVLPQLITDSRVAAWRFDGYWRDVGTISAYYQANLDVLRPQSGLDLDGWQVCTNDVVEGVADRPPAWFGPQAEIVRSRVAEGCRIEGTVRGSVLFPDVYVGPGAIVEDAVLLHGVRVEAGARLSRVVSDKKVVIGASAVLQGGESQAINREFARCDLAGCIVLGRGSHIPEKTVIEPNVVIRSHTLAADIPPNIPAGSTVGQEVQAGE